MNNPEDKIYLGSVVFDDIPHPPPADDYTPVVIYRPDGVKYRTEWQTPSVEFLVRHLYEFSKVAQRNKLAVILRDSKGVTPCIMPLTQSETSVLGNHWEPNPSVPSESLKDCVNQIMARTRQNVPYCSLLRLPVAPEVSGNGQVVIRPSPSEISQLVSREEQSLHEELQMQPWETAKILLTQTSYLYEPKPYSGQASDVPIFPAITLGTLPPNEETAPDKVRTLILGVSGLWGIAKFSKVDLDEQQQCLSEEQEAKNTCMVIVAGRDSWHVMPVSPAQERALHLLKEQYHEQGCWDVPVPLDIQVLTFNARNADKPDFPWLETYWNDVLRLLPNYTSPQIAPGK